MLTNLDKIYMVHILGIIAAMREQYLYHVSPNNLRDNNRRHLFSSVTSFTKSF